MTCPCIGKRGIDLAMCLAPPPGEHEVEVELSKNNSLVINSEGIFTRQIVLDDTLPFTRTLMKRVDPGFIHRVVLRVTEEDLVCMAAKSLIEASNRGSRVAREKYEMCRGLVEEILSGC